METAEGNFQIKRTDLQATLTLTLRFGVVGAQICHQSDNQICCFFFFLFIISTQNRNSETLESTIVVYDTSIQEKTAWEEFYVM